MDTSKFIFNCLIDAISDSYDESVAQSVIERNGDDIDKMSRIEYEQALDDLISIANDRD